MGTLRALSDPDLMLPDPAEDMRGREVRDSAGDEIGHID